LKGRTVFSIVFIILLVCSPQLFLTQQALGLARTDLSISDAYHTNQNPPVVTGDQQKPMNTIQELPIIHADSDKSSVISEHKISDLEASTLKNEIGVYDYKEGPSQTAFSNQTGWRPPTEEEWKIISRDIHVIDSVSIEGTTQLPSFVDHSTDPWFPPIGDQGAQGSCTVWSVAYYMKTFQEAKEHNWDLSQAKWENGQPSAEYQDRIISPAFVYHLINSGLNTGTSDLTAMGLICSKGACSWAAMPYDPGDSASWPSEQAWREAPLYRSDYYYTMNVTNDVEIDNLKNWLASGNLASMTIDAFKIIDPTFGYSLLPSNDLLTLDNYHPPLSNNHEVTIVGYDDNFAYVEEGQYRTGAFKIANSWGVGIPSTNIFQWENVWDGCFWMSYEAMKQYIRKCDVYTDKIGYQPDLVASFKISHSKRGECWIFVGVGSQIKVFSDYINGGDEPFCNNNILFDITDFEEALPTIYNQTYSLNVYDWGGSTTGWIENFAVEYAQSNGTPLQTVDDQCVSVFVVLPHFQTDWISGKLINSDNDFLDSKVSIAADGAGHLYCAYEDRYPSTGHQAIFIEISSDEGFTWSPLTQISSVFDCHNPAMSIDPYDGRVYVAYELEYSISDHDIYCYVYTPGQGGYSVPVDISSNDDRFPSITSEYQYGSSNWQYISYEYIYTYNDRDLMFAKSVNHGSSWTVRKIYGDFPDYNVHTQTSITNAEGYLYLAYRHGADYSSICTINLIRSSDFGDSWTQFANLDGRSTDCHFPNVAASHGGHKVVVAFENDWSATDVDIRYSYSMDNGATWTKGLFLLNSVENEMSPVLAVDGEDSTGNSVGGDFHLVCRVGSYIEYLKTNNADPTSWGNSAFLSDMWVGKGLAITTQYKNLTSEYSPRVIWTNERNRNLYYSTPRGPAYSVTITAHCSSEGIDLAVPITEDGSATGCATPCTFSDISDIHTFTVPSTDPSGHPFLQWSTSESSTTITVSSAGVYTAIYKAPTSLAIVNSLDGSNNFFFTTATKNVGSTIVINITVYNVVNLGTWQAGVSWNPSLLSFVNFTLPSDNVLAYGSPISVYSNGSGNIACGASLSPGFAGFTGSGTCGVVTLRIVQGVGLAPLPSMVSCNLSFTGIGSDTYLLDPSLGNIDFTQVDGHYVFAVPPSLAMMNVLDGSNNFFFTTATESVADTFVINVTINNAVNLATWQASISWDPSLLDFVSFAFPSDNVLAFSSPICSIVPGSGTLMCGATLGPGYSAGFTGSGRLGILILRIVQGVGLAPLPSMVSCNLSFTGIPNDTYLLDPNLHEIDFSAVNGHYKFEFVMHDVATTDLTSAKTIIGQNYTGNFTLNVKDLGNFTETFNVTCCANTTSCLLQNVTLFSGNSTTIAFTWNTTDFAYGNYTISTHADVVPGETNVTNNDCTFSIPVHVGVPGDVSGPTIGVYDKTVNMRDIAYLINHFDTRASSPNWDPNTDINNDGVCNMKDIAIAILYFNQHE
jgi:C1A family cysteine protease